MSQIIGRIDISAAAIAQSVYRIITGWTIRGSSPGGGEIYRVCLGQSRGPPNLLYMGYRVFPGGKAVVA
jgi:hypothetical protein